MKSVKTQILTVMCGLVALSLLTLGIVSIYLNQRTTSGVLEQTMKETAKIAAERVSNQINVYTAIVKNAGLSHEIANPSVSVEKKQDIINEIIAEFPELTRGNILDADGISVFSGDSYSDREYFQKAIKGQAWISEPLISRVTGAVSLIVAAPIWENGVPNSNVIGVVYFVPAETFLNDIVKTIQISPGAGAQIINKKGTVIAHRDMSFVENENNNQEGEKTDPKLKKIASLEREMMKGNVGFGSYSMLGVDKFLAYAPIPNSDGWSIGVNAPISDFMSYTNKSIIYTVIFLILFLAISIIFALNMANNIGTPLRYLSDILTNMTKTGKVELDAEYKQKENELMAKKNEIGSIAIAIDGILSMLKSNAEVFDLIAGGDLSIDITPRSSDDTLGNSMVKMTSSLNTMFSDINRATEQVSTGSRQIAEGAQTLAQGATEQASTIEQLSSSMSELSDKTKENADMASRAADLANTIKGNAEKGSNQMGNMISAVKDISHASQSINKVIKVIDDIAFQTNILALNAAVEAARAGQHGKGFAVVAEEVRNLATKSAEAAKSTGELIAGSMEKADLGVKIADETAESLEEIVSGINESSQIVGDIAKSSEQQAFGISQINKGIEQVALVVQQNSATAEQSAAASEEMSSQALMLEELITQFKLKDDKAYRNSSSNGRASNKHINLDNDLYALSDNSDDFGKY